MKVFISWSGERSQIFAKAVYEWLPMVLQSVVPWLSHADISAGERWADTVAKELESSEFGITCITRENMSSPWIHFEAGALAKRMQEGRVIPLLLDLEFKDIAGPLTQFQAKKAEREGLLGVISAINELSQIKVSDTLLPKQFDALWPTLEKRISEIPKTPLLAKQQRPQHEVLEELVASIRGLDMRVRESVEEPPSLRRRRTRFHPEMVIELSHFSKEITRGGDDPLRLLMLLSLIKDEVPWLYELGVDAYHQTVRGTRGAKQARQRVLGALKMLRRGPWLEMFENKEVRFVYHELERFIDYTEIHERDIVATPRKAPISNARREAPTEDGDM